MPVSIRWKPVDACPGAGALRREAEHQKSSTARKTHDADARVQLRVHREPALLPVDLAQVLFARAVGVAARSVDLPEEHDQASGSAVWECACRGTDLVVAVRLEDVKDRFDVLEVVDTGTCRVCSAAFSRQ